MVNASRDWKLVTFDLDLWPIVVLFHFRLYILNGASSNDRVELGSSWQGGRVGRGRVYGKNRRCGCCSQKRHLASHWATSLGHKFTAAVCGHVGQLFHGAQTVKRWYTATWSWVGSVYARTNLSTYNGLLNSVSTSHNGVRYADASLTSLARRVRRSRLMSTLPLSQLTPLRNSALSVAYSYSLPDIIRNAESINTFKRLLKSLLFSVSYSGLSFYVTACYTSSLY